MVIQSVLFLEYLNINLYQNNRIGEYFFGMGTIFLENSGSLADADSDFEPLNPLISHSKPSTSSLSMPPIFRSNFFILNFIAVQFFTKMLGPEEEGLISHVTEIEISERATGKEEIEGDPPVMVPYIKLFKDRLALNKPKKGKKGKKGGKKKKKK